MDFQDFPKMARLARDVIVTEKIDGTNAQVCIAEDGTLLAGSRTRWITPSDDNFGFAAWVEAHRGELLTLGPGRHFGEWWGAGIQRRYGLAEKRFSLFNVQRWALYDTKPRTYPTADPRVSRTQEVLPPCCGLVPVLYRGPFDTARIDDILLSMAAGGSVAAPGFMKPEGVVVFHLAGNVGFKRTLEKDEMPKALAALAKAGLNGDPRVELGRGYRDGLAGREPAPLMGRPPLPEGEGKTARVEWRTTDARKARAQELATAAGVSLSVWLDALVDQQ